uniref:Uncharacterized protein n=1 Tax=Nelumbo nucifera TaxID=4432 RepID=A0A822YS41_NELNU|nr:TPA_asm: hypothetical protein HUJ06_007625 [Nelumbo nucifera]
MIFMSELDGSAEFLRLYIANRFLLPYPSHFIEILIDDITKFTCTKLMALFGRTYLLKPLNLSPTEVNLFLSLSSKGALSSSFSRNELKPLMSW